MDKINEFLKNNYHGHTIPWGIGYVEFPDVTKRIQCKDGFNISVQANDYVYCNPRKNKAWPYSEVELGYPSELDDLIEDYAEMPDTTETIYPYVPIDVVNKLIEKHGGIANL